MKWSRLKKRGEANFADTVRRRMEARNTRYRDSDDGEGEARVTIDKQRGAGMGTYTYFLESSPEGNRVR